MTRRYSLRGYTAVELMMSIAVLAVGLSGIISMQKITVSTNRDSKNRAIAVEIARSWLDELVADGALWNGANDLATDTEWIGKVPLGEWARPADGTSYTNRPFGAAFDALGNPTQDLTQAQFCTHVRIAELVRGDRGNGLLRAEVRVFWFREGLRETEPNSVCSTALSVSAVGDNPALYHFVYLVGAVRQNPATP